MPDPEPDAYPEAEARIVIDGEAIVAAMFNKGPAEMPEQLLAAGGLRATNVPILSAQLPANPRTRNISEHVYSKPAMPGIRTDCGFAACAGAGA